MVKTINIGRLPEPKAKVSRHVPSAVQPDTLFHFVSKRGYLFEISERKSISPRYCTENLRYLRLPNKVYRLAYPMVCFCDIGLQKLDLHMNCYGSFGIAFPKQRCMSKGVQSVQYLNEEGPLHGDVREAFRAAFRAMTVDGQDADGLLADFLLRQLMYYKPYQGKMRYRVDGVTRTKCLADECEWQFISDVSPPGMPMVVSEEWALDNYLDSYSSVLADAPEVSLGFDIQDVKHIILSSADDLSALMVAAESRREEGAMSDQGVYKLLSKVLVWDEVGGDF